MNKAERIERAKVELQDAINKYGYSLEPGQVLSILATLGAVWVAEEQGLGDVWFPDAPLLMLEKLQEAGWRKVEGA